MAKFSDLLKNGQIPSQQDWVQYLKEAHEQAPGMTPLAFAAHRTVTGKNSYEILAESLSNLTAQPALVVDLACGDGHLVSHILKQVRPGEGWVVGVDQSDAELKKARAHYVDSRVSFYQTEAASLPIEPNSVDVILCHMAFMLMTPIEPVVSEIARVLRPGGRFSAVVGGDVGPGVFQRIRQLSSEKIRSRFPGLREAVTGDTRVNTREGWQELFSSASSGFGTQIEERPFSLVVETTPEGIWEFMKDMYFVNLLSREEQVELRSEWTKLGQCEQTSEGKLSFEFPMKLLSIEKASGSV